MGFTRESWKLWVVVAKRRASVAINVSGLRRVGSDVRRLRAPPWFTVAASGVTELQDVVLPGLRDDVNRCSYGVDELRLGLVPKLQVDVERYFALSLRLDDLTNRFNDEFRALERNTASLSRGIVKFAQVVGILSSGSSGSSGGGSLELSSWEEGAVNLKPRVEQTWQQSFRSVLVHLRSAGLACRVLVSLLAARGLSTSSSAVCAFFVLCLSSSLVGPSVSASRTFWFVLDVSLCCSFASAFTVLCFLFSAHAGSVLLLWLVHLQRDIHKTSTCSQHSDKPHADYC